MFGQSAVLVDGVVVVVDGVVAVVAGVVAVIFPLAACVIAAPPPAIAPATARVIRVFFGVFILDHLLSGGFGCRDPRNPRRL